MTAPRILVTLDLGTEERRGVSFPNVHTKLAYARAVERAGGVPLFVAATANTGALASMLALMDGLVVTGGAFDIDPTTYGESVRGRLDPPKPLRTEFETQLLVAALAADRPVLGVCGGMQLLNVVRGGTLIQDIRTEVEGGLEHEQPSSPAGPDHAVALEPDGLLARLTGASEIEVNTTHHQAVATLGEGLRVDGRSPDGVIEAISDVQRPQILGVQWHPELLDDDASRAIYRHLVASCGTESGKVV